MGLIPSPFNPKRCGEDQINISLRALQTIKECESSFCQSCYKVFKEVYMRKYTIQTIIILKGHIQMKKRLEGNTPKCSK